MKCDKLKQLKNIECAFNTETQQDQVIAEDRDGNCYGFDSCEEVYLKDEVDAAIAELKAEINRKEGVGQRWFERCMEARTENVKLKRALWLARAERAKAIKWCEGLDRYLQERKKHPWPSRFSFMSDDEMYHVWYKCWCKIERKCRAKAEEYK